MTDADIIARVRPFTSVSVERIQNVLSLVERVIHENTPGDLAEVGVWKGGLIMAMALKCKQMGVYRTIHVYDTFSGMTPPSNADVDLNGHRAVDIFELVKCENSYDEVKKNIDSVDYPDIVYHVGDITRTDVSALPTFALLRLDTDWYESTKFELMYMEPRVSLYGFIIVDDYGHWKGSRKAVDEHAPYNMQWIDYTGVWWQRDFGRSLVPKTSEYGIALYDNFHHFVALGPRFHRGCGSYLFDGQSYHYQPATLPKQEALFEVGMKSSRVLEVGVYLGHSLLILLLANPTLQVVCIDNDSTFSPAAVDYLNKHFQNRVTFHLGQSSDILNGGEIGMFDCVHIDADHTPAAVMSDFYFTRPFASALAYYVFDDYEAVRHCIDDLIVKGVLSHVVTPWCLWTNTITRLNNISL